MRARHKEKYRNWNGILWMWSNAQLRVPTGFPAHWALVQCWHSCQQYVQLQGAGVICWYWVSHCSQGAGVIWWYCVSHCSQGAGVICWYCVSHCSQGAGVICWYWVSHCTQGAGVICWYWVSHCSLWTRSVQNHIPHNVSTATAVLFTSWSSYTTGCRNFNWCNLQSFFKSRLTL